MKIKCNQICPALIFCFLILHTNIVVAGVEENDKPDNHYSGKIVFKPSLDTSYRYESNYYLDDIHEVSASTYVLKPGFEFGYATPKSRLLFDYYLSANEYTGDYRVSDDDYIGHDLDFLVETQVTDHLLFGGKEEYRKSRGTGALDTLGNEIIRQKYQVNLLSPWVHYAVNDTWGMSGKYEYSWLNYDDEANEDSEGHRGIFTLEYNLNNTSLLILDYNVWTRDYDKNTPTYTSNQVSLSYEKEFRLFSLNAGGGYQERSFADFSEQDFAGFIWKLTLRGEQAKTRYVLNLNQNYNDFGEGQQYYKGVGLYAEVGHLFIEKIDFTLSVDLRNRDYENRPREDDNLILTGNLDYLFTDRFSIGMESAYEKRDSNQPERDYVNTYFLINAKFAFDFAPR